MLFRQENPDVVRGLTTAASILAVVAIGAAAGEGRLLLATVATAVTLLILERRYLPVLRVLDGGRWASRLGHEDLVPSSTGQDPEHTAPGREDDG